jgi:hypothetical protein
LPYLTTIGSNLPSNKAAYNCTNTATDVETVEANFSTIPCTDSSADDSSKLYSFCSAF